MAKQYYKMEKSNDQHVKKLFIKNKVGDLKYTDRLYILQILKQHTPSRIIENADGCRINLDRLDVHIIDKLHHIISSKINNILT